MEYPSNSCPNAEVVAAFVAGHLSGAELQMTSEHVRECEDCRSIVREASRFEPAPEPATPPKRRLSPRPRIVASAAALGAALVLAWPAIRSWRAAAPLRELVAAAPADGRYVEARISGGFRWAPLYGATRGAKSSDPVHMQLVGVAGNVIEQTSGDVSAAAQHASALARLLSGFAADASAQLSRLSQSSSEGRVWSDLAAARYTEAVQNDDPSKLAQALSAAEAALHADAALPEALFNRALILERLGLSETARDAWKRYLAADAASAWTHEAELHAQALSSPPDFSHELDRAYAALDDGRSVADLVDRFPQESRMWGESEILNRWALCVLGGDAEGAAPSLRLARMIGDELARRNGEMLLHDAVAAVDRATDVRLLAEAHTELRKAQKIYKQQEYARAEPLFRNVALKFEAAHSPMALLAGNYLANAVYEQRRVDEARIQLEQLSRQCPLRFKAQTAHIQWELGMAYARLGRWGRAIETLNLSIAGFDAIRETLNEMSVREILGEIYDRIGEPRKGWDFHIVALQQLGRYKEKVDVPVYAIARSAALNRDSAVGLTFLDLLIDFGPDRGSVMYTHGLLLRAALHAKAGDRRAAADDLAKAAAAMASIPEAAERQSAEAERVAVQASLAASPAEAIDLLSRAIEVESTTRRMFVPELLLQRGRAFKQAGRHDQAADDFDAGIRELEQQRVSIAPGDERWGMFATADELFDDAVELAIEKGNPARAFDYSERARARELLDSMGMTVVPATRAALPDAVILEYMQLRDRIVIFVVDGARIRAVEEPVASTVMSEAIDHLARSATSGNTNDFNRAATELYDHLLGPVADELAADNPLVVVPDGVLGLVPFAALMDPAGRYVIERRAVIVAPSVAALRNRSMKTLAPSPGLLVVAGPASRAGDLGRLTAEQHEIESVAAEYRDVHYARGGDVAGALQHPAAPANVIHFVGHAVMPDVDTAGALVTSRRESAADQLDVREIAAMSLREVDVVVLAACGTARGYGRAGESSVSVARAFLAAGVPSVAATLWPIEDGPAADFFPRFHHYLVRGLPPADALRAAQLELIHRRETSPGVWAAVEIIGM